MIKTYTWCRFLVTADSHSLAGGKLVQQDSTTFVNAEDKHW
jgi:hypothetical protein